jgi:hypothetical protein
MTLSGFGFFLFLIVGMFIGAIHTEDAFSCFLVSIVKIITLSAIVAGVTISFKTSLTKRGTIRQSITIIGLYVFSAFIAEVYF